MQATLTAIGRPGTPYTTWTFEVKGKGSLTYWCGREAWTYEWRCDGKFDSHILNGIINAHQLAEVQTGKWQAVPVGTVLTF